MTSRQVARRDEIQNLKRQIQLLTQQLRCIKDERRAEMQRLNSVRAQVAEMESKLRTLEEPQP